MRPVVGKTNGNLSRQNLGVAFVRRRDVIQQSGDLPQDYRDHPQIPTAWIFLKHGVHFTRRVCNNWSTACSNIHTARRLDSRHACLHGCVENRNLFIRTFSSAKRKRQNVYDNKDLHSIASPHPIKQKRRNLGIKDNALANKESEKSRTSTPCQTKRAREKIAKRI